MGENVPSGVPKYAIFYHFNSRLYLLQVSVFSLIMYLEKLAWTSGIKSTPFLESDWLTALHHLTMDNIIET